MKVCGLAVRAHFNLLEVTNMTFVFGLPEGSVDDAERIVVFTHPGAALSSVSILSDEETMFTFAERA